MLEEVLLDVHFQMPHEHAAPSWCRAHWVQYIVLGWMAVVCCRQARPAAGFRGHCRQKRRPLGRLAITGMRGGVIPDVE